MTSARSWRPASLPGVARLRRIAERTFTPQVRADVLALQTHLDALRGDHDQLVRQVGQLAEALQRAADKADTEASLAELRTAMADLAASAERVERRMADVGDSVATSNALARRVQRELDRVLDPAEARDPT